MFSGSKMPAIHGSAHESAKVVHRGWSFGGTNRHMFRCLLILVSLLAGSPALVRGDVNRLTDQDELFARLVAPKYTVVDGKSFRGALNSIAEHAQVNLWLDRLVDPTASVAMGAIGPTPFAAIQKLADSRGCVVMPVANVTTSTPREISAIPSDRFGSSTMTTTIRTRRISAR